MWTHVKTQDTHFRPLLHTNDHQMPAPSKRVPLFVSKVSQQHVSLDKPMQMPLILTKVVHQAHTVSQNSLLFVLLLQSTTH